MGASFSAELLKLRKRWSTWVIGIILVLLVALFGYVFTWIGYQSLSSANVPANELQAMQASLKERLLPAFVPHQTASLLSTLGGALVLIYAVLVVGSEYGWNTMKTILTQRPGRLEILVGKGAAIVLVAFIYVVAAFIAAFISSYVTSNLVGASIIWPSASSLLGGFGSGLLIVLAWAAFGVFLSALFRGTAWAIAFGLVYAVIIENILARLLGLVDWLKGVIEFLLAQNAGALAYSLPRPKLSSEFGGPSTALAGPTHAALVLLGWLVIATIIAAVLYRQLDVA